MTTGESNTGGNPNPFQNGETHMLRERRGQVQLIEEYAQPGTLINWDQHPQTQTNVDGKAPDRRVLLYTDDNVFYIRGDRMIDVQGTKDAGRELSWKFSKDDPLTDIVVNETAPFSDDQPVRRVLILGGQTAPDDTYRALVLEEGDGENKKSRFFGKFEFSPFQDMDSVLANRIKSKNPDEDVSDLIDDGPSDREAAQQERQANRAAQDQAQRSRDNRQRRQPKDHEQHDRAHPDDNRPGRSPREDRDGARQPRQQFEPLAPPAWRTMANSRIPYTKGVGKGDPTIVSNGGVEIIVPAFELAVAFSDERAYLIGNKAVEAVERMKAIDAGEEPAIGTGWTYIDDRNRTLADLSLPAHRSREGVFISPRQAAEPVTMPDGTINWQRKNWGHQPRRTDLHIPFLKRQLKRLLPWMHAWHHGEQEMLEAEKHQIILKDGELTRTPIDFNEKYGRGKGKFSRFVPKKLRWHW